MRLRVDLGRTGSPVLLGVRSQHEQRCEHRNGDERNGRDEQRGGRDQKDRGQREKNCSEGQDYSESKNDITFPHVVFEEAIIWPGFEWPPDVLSGSSRRWVRIRSWSGRIIMIAYSWRSGLGRHASRRCKSRAGAGR